MQSLISSNSRKSYLCGYVTLDEVSQQVEDATEVIDEELPIIGVVNFRETAGTYECLVLLANLLFELQIW